MAEALFALLATTAIQLLASMALVTVPVLAPAASAEVGLSASLVGFFISIAYGASMVGALVSGGLVLRHGAIRVSQVALVVCAAGLGCVVIGTQASMVAAAVLIGLGYGPITPASSHILARAAPPGRMSLVFSLKQTGVPLGGAAAGAFVPPLVLQWGWRGAVAFVAAACIAAALASQPLRADLDADREPGRRGGSGGAMAALRLTIREPMLRRLAACSFCFAVVQYALIGYLVTYLTGAIGYSLVAAGLMLTVAQVGGAFARIAWGVVADRSGRPMRLLGMLAAGMVLGAVATAAFAPTTPRAWIVAACGFFGAMAIGWNGVFLAQAARFAPAGEASVATAGALFFTFSGVLVGPSAFAVLLQLGLGYGTAFVLMALPAGGCAAWLLSRNLDAVPGGVERVKGTAPGR